MKEFKINSDNTIDINLRENILLEASAGTGKTYSLERVVLNLIKDKKYNLNLRDILVVTFTNKATREMKERIRQILIDEYRRENDLVVRKRLEDAIGSFDEASIFTIHSFCQNTLQTFPFESMSLFNQEISQDSSLLEAAVWDYLRELEDSGDSSDLEEYYAFRGKLSFSDVVKELVKLVNTGKYNGEYYYYPDNDDIRDINKLRHEFDSGESDLCQRLEEFKIPSANMFHEASKAMGVATRISSFEKLNKSFNSLDIGRGFIHFLSQFYTKGFCENAYKLTSEFLEKKSRKGLTVSEIDVTSREIILNMDEVFAFLEIFFDKNNLTKNPMDKLLAGEFIKKSVKAINKIYKLKQEKRGVLSYNDLIENLHNGVMKKGENPLLNSLRRRYKVALIDEFQDTDKLQWDIFHKIFGEGKEHNYLLIGDPKQSIYGFRGADLEIYYKAKKSVKEENRYFLGTNYRSEKGVVLACNKLFGKVFGVRSKVNTKATNFTEVGSTDKKRRVVDTVSQNVEFLVYDKDIEDGKTLSSKECKTGYFKTVVNKTVQLLNNRDSAVAPGDIAILVESHRDSQFLRDSLLYRGVPAIISRQKNVFCSREAEHLLTLLRALNNPGGVGEIKATLLSPLFGYSLHEVHNMEEIGELEVVSTQFLLWRERLVHSGIIGLWKDIETYSEKGHLQTRLLTTVNGERAYTNYKHLIESLNNMQRNERLNSLSLYQKLHSLTLSSSEDEENSIRLDRESQAVQIMTIHASKGLEFPIVFFAGGLNKSGSSSGEYGTKYAEKGGIWSIDFLSKESSNILAERDEWEERKRLYYVAFTRASSKVYMPLFPNGELLVLTNIYASLNWDQNKLLIEDRLDDKLDMFEQPVHKQLKMGTGKKSSEIKKAYIEKLYEDVKDLVNRNNQLFHIDDKTFLDSNSDFYEVEQVEESLTFDPLKSQMGFRNRITWVSSYSGLTKDSHGSISKEDADRDDDEEDIIVPVKVSDEINSFNIPGGATFGDLVHEFFEQVDFNSYKLGLNEFIEDESVHEIFLSEAKKHFDLEWAKKYEHVTKSIIWNTLNTKLPFGEELVALGAFDNNLKIHEREFYFRVDINNKFNLHGLELIVEEGYLKGFIDLILNYEGKLYIADWKTTTIKGNECYDDYNIQAIEKSMDEHNYHLQGLMYTVALYLHLEKTKDDFNYEHDIGGYFYFFVRGMSPDKNTGVCFYKPTEEEVLGFIREVRGYL